MAIDRLADALNTIKTHEIAGQNECTVKASKLISSILQVLKTHGYIKDFSFAENHQGGYFNIQLDGKINDCRVIKPRLPVKHEELAKIEQQFIPGVGVGLVIISTSEGLMTNLDAEKRQIGGRLIAYIY